MGAYPALESFYKRMTNDYGRRSIHGVAEIISNKIQGMEYVNSQFELNNIMKLEDEPECFVCVENGAGNIDGHVRRWNAIG